MLFSPSAREGFGYPDTPKNLMKFAIDQTAKADALAALDKWEESEIKLVGRVSQIAWELVRDKSKFDRESFYLGKLYTYLSQERKVSRDGE